jgi:hypothetical protein
MRRVHVSSRSGRAAQSTRARPAPLPNKRFVRYCDVICDSLSVLGNPKGHIMSKRKLFRPSDSPLTEYEKEQIAMRKNLERLKAERLAREAANPKED